MIIVVGDVLLDKYLTATSTRLAPEYPIPIYDIKDEVYKLGGAANVANNLVSLGTETCLVGILGNDKYGEIVKNLLHNNGIRNECLQLSRCKTIVKNRIIINDKIVTRFDYEHLIKLEDIDITQILHTINDIIVQNKVDIIIISDYLKGICHTKILTGIKTLINNTSIKLFIDSKDPNYDKYIGSFLVKPNLIESEIIMGEKLSNFNTLESYVTKLYEKLQCKILLLTLSDKGLVLKYDDIYRHISIDHPSQVIDVTGAGDVVISAFCYWYIKTSNIIESSIFSNFCGQIKVQHFQTYTLSYVDILNFKLRYTSKNISYEECKELCDIIKKVNKKIVFTNGCFDILHYGHIQYLEKSKEYGDILIVGINSDTSVKKNKGTFRPINPLKYRIDQLCSLRFIDYVISFDEDTPIKLLEMIKPFYLIKGGDYSYDEIIGKEYAKNVKILDYVNDISSSEIIRKLLVKH